MRTSLTAALHKRLDEPHIAPLTAYARRLGRMGRGRVPYFDPQDGGVLARVLFLFEKPGPKTDPIRGSGFICRENNDPSAAAARLFWQQARIPREWTVLWNVMPWWDGAIYYTSGDARAGLAELAGLVALLPRLEVIVLVGLKAWQAEPQFKLPVIKSYHPGPKVRSVYPDKHGSIPGEWAKVHRYLSASPTIAGDIA